MGFLHTDKFLTTFSSTSRLALLEKLDLKNTHACPTLTKIQLFIELKRLENFDNARLLAAMFILALVGGGKPYVLRFNLFQTFHEKDYDVRVVSDLAAKDSQQFVEFFTLSVLPFLSKADLSSYALTFKNGVLVHFTIADLSFIRVVETHSIFFKWHDKLNVKFYINAHELSHAFALLNVLGVHTHI